MYLHLKRDEGLKNFDLFAKLELDPEEQTLIKRTQPGKTYLWVPDARSAQSEWRISLIPGAFLAIIVGFVIGAFFVGIKDAQYLAVPIGFLVWIPCTKLVFNQRRQGITVSDLITGRTIHSKSFEEMLRKEEAIRESLRNFGNAIGHVRSSKGGESIPI